MPYVLSPTIVPWKGTVAGKILCKGSTEGLGVVVVEGVTREWQMVSALCTAICCISRGLEFSDLFESWSRMLISKVLRSLKYRGLVETVKALKEFALYSRQEALRTSVRVRLRFRCGLPCLAPLSANERDKRLMQFSRFSRALPAPRDVDGDAALCEHRAILQSKGVVEASVLKDLYDHCVSIGGRYGRSLPYQFASPSESASFETPRSKGGAAEEIRVLSDSFRATSVETRAQLEMIAAGFPEGLFGEHSFLSYDEAKDRSYPCRLDEVAFLHNRCTEMSLDGWELCRERLFSVAACWLHVEWDSVPIVRRIVLLERGWKTRVVTPGDAAFNYLCSAGGKMLMGILRKHPAIKGSTTGHPADGIDWSTGARHNCVRSLDLKAASDYLPHEVNYAVISGILNGVGAPDWLRKLSMRAVGPCLVRESTGVSWYTSRAALMGNPLTWPILNLVLDFCHAQSGTDGFYGINGDDYIGSHSFSSNYNFTKCVKSVGLVLSDMKDFFSYHGRGVFAEELITVGRMRVYPSISCRVLCAVERREDCRPLWSDGPAVNAAVNRVDPCEREHLVSILDFTYRSELSKLRRCGIDPCAPRWAGGGGFPGNPTQYSLRVMRGILSQEDKVSLNWVLRLCSAWAYGVPSAAVDMAREIVERLLSEFPATEEKGVGEGSLSSDLQASLLGQISYAFKLAMPPEMANVAQPRLTLTAKKIKDVLTCVASVAYWVGRDFVYNVGGLLRLKGYLEPRYRLKSMLFRCDYQFQTPLQHRRRQYLKRKLASMTGDV